MSTDLCMNRKHIREDMLWLAAHSFDAIHIACHEEHYRQPLGMQLIIEEAHCAGLNVFAIPSRWCGLVAGWPVLAGHFAATRPDTWMVREDGQPLIKNFCGPLCSVHHPDVQAHMVTCVERMFETFDFDGITWDELKTLHETDYHPIAIETFGGPVSGEKQIQASLDVFAACNRTARQIKPDVRIVSFLYAELPDDIIVPWAGTEGFDDIGPDGKVARGEDLQTPKVLIDNMPRFIDAAKTHGKRSFCLIETQNFDKHHADVTLQRLPEFLTQPVEHIAVYYQPLVKEPAAQITEQIGPILRDWRRQG
jgi:hypothetical protein